MERRLKERLFGAGVLIALAVIFIPMLFDDPNLVISTPILSTEEVPEPPLPAQSTFDVPKALQAAPIEKPVAPLAPPTAEREQPELAEAVVTTAPVATAESITATEPIAKAAKTPAPVVTKPKASTVTSLAGEIPTLERPAAYAVQLGIFSRQENADLLVKRLRDKDYDAYSRKAFGDDTKVRVLVGPRIDRKKAEALRQQIATEFSIEGFVIPYQPIEG